MNHLALIKIFFLGSILFVFTQVAKGQQNNTLYFMNSVPQASLLNPAYSIPCNYFGLPVISSFHTDIGNTAFSYNQLFPIKNGSRIVDFDYLENGLHNLDLMNAQVHMDIFSLGYGYQDYYFTFRITEKTDLFVSYPKQAFLVPWKGNTGYVGETAKIRRMGASFNHYREYALTASTWLRDDLKFGITAGILFGKLNLNTSRERLDIYTAEDSHHLHSSGSYEINASLPVSVDENTGGEIPDVRLNDNLSLQRIIFNRKNPGFSLDFGGIYTGLNDVVLYGSLLNMGMIRWSSGLNNAELKHSFRFKGITREDLQNSDYRQDILDSLEDSYTVSFSQNSYTTFFPLESYFGVTYDLTRSTSAGIFQRNFFYKGRIFPSMTLSLNAKLFDLITFSASYSYNKYSFNNFGAGFVLGRKNLQFYMVSDNLGAITPLKTRNINLRFGLNLLFGCGSSPEKKYTTPPASGTGCFWIRQRLENEKILPNK